MRTTLTIDDEVYRLIKQRAAQTGRTVGTVVEEALRAALLASPTVPTSPVELPVDEGGPLPGVDLDDSSALYDLTEQR